MRKVRGQKNPIDFFCTKARRPNQVKSQFDDRCIVREKGSEDTILPPIEKLIHSKTHPAGKCFDETELGGGVVRLKERLLFLQSRLDRFDFPERLQTTLRRDLSTVNIEIGVKMKLVQRGGRRPFFKFFYRPLQTLRSA